MEPSFLQETSCSIAKLSFCSAQNVLLTCLHSCNVRCINMVHALRQVSSAWLQILFECLMKGFKHKYLKKNIYILYTCKALNYATEITWNLPGFFWVILNKYIYIYIYIYIKKSIFFLEKNVMFSGVSKAPKIIITLYFLQGKSQVAL